MIGSGMGQRINGILTNAVTLFVNGHLT